MTHECGSDEAVATDVEKYGLSVMLVREAYLGPIPINSSFAETARSQAMRTQGLSEEQL